MYSVYRSLSKMKMTSIIETMLGINILTHVRSELQLLNEPMVRTTHSRQNLSFRGPVIWNDLPQVVTEN